MYENDVILDNILSEVMDYIRQLKMRKTTFGGYDKEYVMYTIQEICSIYEKHISKTLTENKEHFDMLNNEISELRQKNDALSHRGPSDPAIIDKANQAIAEANKRIDTANAHITQLQALYEEAEAKIREQEEYIGVLNTKQTLLTQNISAESPDIVAEAKNTADDIIRRANEEAAALRASAKTDIDTVANAKNTADDIIKRANEEAAALRASAKTDIDTVANAKNTADDIIRRANEEAETLRIRARSDANAVADAKNSASDIIRRANEEAETLRTRARNDADAAADARNTANDIIRRANEESERLRLRARNDADVVVDARNTANEIIRRAKEESDKLRMFARNEAESLIRERRAEIRAEERMHEERISELKDKYSKYSDFFSKMLSGVRSIEGDVAPLIKKQEEYKADSYDTYDKISRMSWYDDSSNNGFKDNIL